MKVLITGITGNIGSLLAEIFSLNGSKIVGLSRTNNSIHNYDMILWKHLEEDASLLPADIDVVVHLAGDNIGNTPWNEKGMKAIYDSRINTAITLFNCFEKSGYFPKLYISASATGYYENGSLLPPAVESESCGSGFLSDVCVGWESVAELYKANGSRVVIMRLGSVMSKTGGMLASLKKMICFRAATVLGNGKQLVPWVHFADVLSFVKYAMENPHIKGTYNLVSPEVISFKKLIFSMTDMMNRKVLLPPIPPMIVKMLLGKKSVLVLEGRNVSAAKVLNSGFEFKYGDLLGALRNILK